MLVRRIARPMLASTFVVMGIDVLRKPGSRADVAAPLVEGARATLPAPAAALVPADPDNAVRLNALVQIGGGLMLATGKYPRVASSVLAATLLPTTVAGHPFWAETDPQRRQVQQVQFLKNISILGGLLLAAVDTEGKPSLSWRGRKAAAKASATLAEALPSAQAQESLVHNLAETAHLAGDRASSLADLAAARGSALADVAVQRGSALAAEAGALGSALADTASARGAALADLLAAEAPELRRRARKTAERTLKTAERTVKKAERARKSADHAAKAALAKAEELRHNLV